MSSNIFFACKSLEVQEHFCVSLCSILEAALPCPLILPFLCPLLVVIESFSFWFWTDLLATGEKYFFFHSTQATLLSFIFNYWKPFSLGFPTPQSDLVRILCHHLLATSNPPPLHLPMKPQNLIVCSANMRLREKCQFDFLLLQRVGMGKRWYNPSVF